MFKGWGKSRKILLGLSAVAICLILVCSTMTAFTSMPKTTGTNQNTFRILGIYPETVVNGTREIYVNNTSPEGCISAEQAIQMAMPYINQYATEHNRTIINLTATFCASIRDMAASRGDSSEFYPMWHVNAEFEKLSNLPTPNPDVFPDYIFPEFINGYPAAQCWIDGYCVVIWADNAQIIGCDPQGRM